MVETSAELRSLDKIGAVAKPGSQRPLAKLTLDERRSIIIDRAARLFEANGYGSTSMRDIADDLGLAKAAVYYYFRSKQELLYAIHDTFLSDMSAKAQEFLGEHDDPRDQLRFFVRSIIETVASYQPYVKVFFQELSSLDPEHYRLVSQKRDAYELLVENAIERGIAEGTLDPGVSPRLAALFLFGACNWTYQWLGAKGPAKPEELADAFYELILRGFAGTLHGSSSAAADSAR